MYRYIDVSSQPWRFSNMHVYGSCNTYVWKKHEDKQYHNQYIFHVFLYFPCLGWHNLPHYTKARENVQKSMHSGNFIELVEAWWSIYEPCWTKSSLTDFMAWRRRGGLINRCGQLDPKYQICEMSQCSVFRYENALENIVCKMSIILLWPQCLKCRQ